LSYKTEKAAGRQRNRPAYRCGSGWPDVASGTLSARVATQVAWPANNIYLYIQSVTVWRRPLWTWGFGWKIASGLVLSFRKHPRGASARAARMSYT